MASFTGCQADSTIAASHDTSHGDPGAVAVPSGRLRH